MLPIVTKPVSTARLGWSEMTLCTAHKKTKPQISSVCDRHFIETMIKVAADRLCRHKCYHPSFYSCFFRCIYFTLQHNISLLHFQVSVDITRPYNPIYTSRTSVSRSIVDTCCDQSYDRLIWHLASRTNHFQASLNKCSHMRAYVFWGVTLDLPK